VWQGYFIAFTELSHLTVVALIAFVLNRRILWRLQEER
jgi:hypothetical protein